MFCQLSVYPLLYKFAHLSVVIPCLVYLQKYTYIDSLVFNSNMDSSTPVVVFSVIATRCVVKPAEFDVARNVLDLINAQTLAWYSNL